MKPIHGEAVPLWQQRGLEPVPPVPCPFKMGDLVTFTNDAGLKFPGKRVVGFGATADAMPPTKNHPTPGMVGSFIYLDTDAHWFPHRVDELTLETPAPSRYAHGGSGEDLSPMEDGRRREQAIADGLRRLAKRCGITLREPLNIDSNGEFHLIASNGTDRDGAQDQCGHYGEAFAVLIAKHGSRTGYVSHNHRAASDGWCMMNHFSVQAMLEDAEGHNLLNP